MTHQLDIDFEAYNPANFFHALRLQASEAGQPRTLDELGTGEEQLLALAFAHAYAKAFHGGLLFIIEEPESHLHPLAQDWLARKIRMMAADGLQIVLTTHSQSFIDLLNIRGLALVTKTDDAGTGVKQLTTGELVAWCQAHGARLQPGVIGAFYHASATPEIKDGFFARRVVLVEGPTEALSLPVFLGAAGLDAMKEGVAIVPVGGKGSLAKWWRLFTAYGIPVYVIFDNDRGDDGAGQKRTDLLRTLGEANVGPLLQQTDALMRPQFAVFGRDFEATFRAWFDDYVAIEAEARTFLASDSKPLIARYVATKLAEDHGDDAGWQHMRILARRIRQIAAPE